jgi:CheY-like chemotaxis protein
METILIVDDEPAVLKLCQRMLKFGGYNALPATSGLEALRLLRESNCVIDLAVLDVMMPGMNGVELAKCIHSVNPDIPIVLMTGYGPEEIMRVVGENNPYRIMWKPFNTESLCRMVENVIGASAGTSI